jgi:hypothetical protein
MSVAPTLWKDRQGLQTWAGEYLDIRGFTHENMKSGYFTYGGYFEYSVVTEDGDSHEKEGSTRPEPGH